MLHFLLLLLEMQTNVSSAWEAGGAWVAVHATPTRTHHTPHTSPTGGHKMLRLAFKYPSSK